MSVIILTPIIADAPDDHTHLDALKSLMYGDNWYRIRKKHLEELPMLHMARFQIIEHLVPAMGDEAKADELLTKFLLFVAEADGQSYDLFDHMYREEPQSVRVGTPESRTAGTFVRSIWDHCVGYPEVAEDSIYRFRQYMQSHEIDTNLYYPATTRTRDEILNAMCKKQLTAAWISCQSRRGSTAGSLGVNELENYLWALNFINGLHRVELLSLYHFLFEPTKDGEPPMGLTFDDVMDHLRGTDR